MALYNEERPGRFGELIGQEAVTRVLAASAAGEQADQVFLFTGTRGTGKTSAARIYAAAVNCENPREGEPCGTCPSCRAIRTGQSLCVIELDAARNRGIDDISRICESAMQAPIGGAYKVFIIDEVHMLTTEASNCLLKTLEEPPRHAIFILCTTEEQKVLMTIKSRALHFHFRSIREDAITKHLKEVCISHGFSYEEEALGRIAEQSGGAMRDALSILDQISKMGAVTREHVAAALGDAPEELVLSLLEEILKPDLPGMHASLMECRHQAVPFGMLVESLCKAFLDLTEAAMAGDTDLIRGSESYKEELGMIISSVETAQLIRLCGDCLKAVATARYRAAGESNPYLYLGVVLAEVIARTDKEEEQERRITRLEEEMARKPAMATSRPDSREQSGAEAGEDRACEMPDGSHPGGGNDMDTVHAALPDSDRFQLSEMDSGFGHLPQGQMTPFDAGPAIGAGLGVIGAYEEDDEDYDMTALSRFAGEDAGGAGGGDATKSADLTGAAGIGESTGGCSQGFDPDDWD